ncbi:MAG TPA: TetR/AcrR family transcriptional regulator [Actinomycetes bacterium]|nr:TetR/AcrR family transcriptional regulator [Actinomycetes bacterium]
MTTRTYHHGQLRESLIDAGVELARAGGPEAVQLRAVSRAAGVSHNAAYRHFTDLDDLLAAVCTRAMRELALLMEDRMARVTTRVRVRRAWDRLDAIGTAYVEFARREPGWFRTAFSVGADPEAVGEEGVGRSGLSPYGLLGACLDDLVAVGALDADRRDGAEYAAWSMVHGLSALLVEGPLRILPDEEVARALRVSLGVVRRGL